MTSIYGVLLTVTCSVSFWGHSVHFRDFFGCRQPCILKMAHRANWIKIWSSWVSSLCKPTYVIWCVSDFRQICILKMARYRAKQTKNRPNILLLKTFRAANKGFGGINHLAVLIIYLLFPTFSWTTTYLENLLPWSRIWDIGTLRTSIHVWCTFWPKGCGVQCHLGTIWCIVSKCPITRNNCPSSKNGLQFRDSVMLAQHRVYGIPCFGYQYIEYFKDSLFN